MANNDEVVVLKRRRAIIIGSCTRVRTFADSIESVTPPIAAQLEERRAKLDGYWSSYDEVQTKLELCDEAEANHRVTFEEAFYFTSAKVRELLSSASQMRATASPSPSPSISGVVNQYNHIKLPRLDLPKFSGKYDEWFPFFDSFQSLIHANPSLDNIQRLQYLKASVVGDAAKIITALEISGTNYDVAWNLLKERYDNKRVIVQSHIKAIMDLPSMSKENVVELRQIADGTTRHVQALKALKRPTAQWDDLLVQILTSKLDALTSREWQLSLTSSQLPTLKQFIDFITHRCQTLEANGKPAVPAQAQHNARRQSCLATVKAKCVFCKGEHFIYHCQKFLALPVRQRISEIRKRKLCTNCLRSTDHASNKCPSGSCKICNSKHNSLLHLTAAISTKSDTSNPRESPVDDKGGAPPASSPTALVTHSANSPVHNCVMLSTAVVSAHDSKGALKSCRVLLDSGSQANFISQRFLDTLGLRTRASEVSISGINKTTTRSLRAVEVHLQSRINSFNILLDCIVTDHVTDKLPAFTIKRSAFEIPQNIKLADPQFNVASEIDLLIGAEQFWRLLCVGQIKSSPTQPILQKTRFGWILAGRLDNSSTSRQGVQSFHASISNAQLQQQLSQFWQIEDITQTSDDHSVEEHLCEQHFLQNLSRDPQGRLIVKLPFKELASITLGDSRGAALKRLYGIEKRFKLNPNLRTQYSEFMNEYLALGHMKAIDEQSDNNSESFYLPHHCVFKSNQGRDKIRVVFDASAKGSTGTSLNDVLMVGPTVQQDLFSILVRFRTFRFVLTADIIKMYRQVLIYPSQTHYQRILWRDDPASDVKAYELVTLTYGTSSASYLATRCLKWLADHYADEFPAGSACVERDFYVDDMLTGADTVEEALAIRDQTIEVLRAGAFELSKWASNCSDLLTDVEKQTHVPVTINKGTESSILGVHWDQLQDTLHFSYKPDADRSTISKRVILSEVSKLFDPLGFWGPVIVSAKLILQELWHLGSHWDESVPQELHIRWTNLKSRLVDINKLAIPRHVKLNANSQPMQVHGFCDASQLAYGACIYIRTRSQDGTYNTELLCSKSRVAPLKAISLPRLELSAALLLANLLNKVRASITITDSQIFLWSDSTIVLNWIASPSRRWSIFVSNRVGQIQNLTEPSDWRHVKSVDNPADILSRGLDPQKLVESSMWWHGPPFLRLDEEHWPDSGFVHSIEGLPEQKRSVTAILIVDHSVINELLTRHSNLNKACRILAYCLRFLKRYRPKEYTTFVSHQEISTALQIMCKLTQNQAFPQEHKALRKGHALDTSSSILSLAPFISEDGLIRVGGRLVNSDLSFDACHPILLPRDHALTRHIIELEHRRNAHAGAQATMAAVRQRFWPISLRSITRKVVRNCVTCFKAKPVHSEAIMGSLPAGRVTVSRPFAHCGIDYAGPFTTRESKRRNARNQKAYLALFVCFATKAVHCELVSDLSTDSFLATLKRFASRRGRPSCIYSDNGTTFVGAQRQLREFSEFLRNEKTQAEITNFLREQETEWKFIPPNAPHFGGLWEAAVKSVKRHLHRIAGNSPLTFEELQTIFCEVEAILNSRPLTPLSNDPNDLTYLSPGHFLIGTTLNSFPYHDLINVSENRLVRWQRVEQARQHLWRRWSQEYLHTLQERSKWRVNKGEQLKSNQMVLLKQQGLPPMQWLLGRVEEVHPGPDNIVRTATVRTAKGVYVRPLSKIAILPMDA
ncbi:PREDICTED: uncharacterized protein LOC108763994 [Trachymyrmex cornetzi]|uniref:uncharacterized protein LOC108763994 n=1 Tax=Trachymyrmex cornetzi TaxID=471704 RepID=UPI00084F03DD|nr:PREDICTED: uncharacterized protein LOC108763994 [Trachymyrmex cornetzi]